MVVAARAVASGCNVRNYDELVAAATATGTFAGYIGDGASVPWQVALLVSRPLGYTLWTYQAYLDFRWPAGFKLHDWCYTPYGGLIDVTRDEADSALREYIARDSAIDAAIVYGAVRVGGIQYFGRSTTGYTGPVSPWLPMDFGSAFFPQPRSTSMPLIRCTYFFTGGNYGWSETYFKVDTDIPTVVPKALALGIARRAILTPQFTVIGYRLSVDDVFRDAKLVLSGAGIGAGQYPSTTPEESKEAFEALLCRLETADFKHRRQLYVRGVPEVVSDPYGNFLQVATFNTRATIFFDLLRLNRSIGGANPDPWHIRVPDPVQTDVQIDALTIDAGGVFINVTPNVAIGGAAITVPAQLYNIRGVTSPKGASATWRLKEITTGPPQVLKLGPKSAPIAGVFSGVGVIRGRYLWVGSTIGNVDAVRVIRRSTGRPFGSARGRRKGR